MKIFEFLIENKSDIVSQWQQAIIDTYPKDAGKFLLGKEDRFANPIGYFVRTELPVIYDELTADMDENTLRESILNIIKIRAVQEFTISEATGFIFFLKSIIQRKYVSSLNNQDAILEFFNFEKRIDKVSSMIFEIYLEMKIKISEIKFNEVKKRNHKMIERLSRKYDLMDSYLDDNNS